MRKSLSIALFVMLGMSIVAFGADDTAKKLTEIYSSAEYKQLSDSFSDVCRQNESLRGQIAQLQKIQITTNLSAEDRARLDRFDKIYTKLDLYGRWVLLGFAALDGLLFLIILIISANRSKWKKKSLGIEAE